MTKPKLPSKKFWNNAKVMTKHWEDTIRAEENECLTCGKHNAVCCADCYSKDIKQARADEREKMKKEGSLLYLETEVQDLQRQAYKKGQAELIEQGWEILQSYNGTALWHSKHFLLMLKKASESLGADSSLEETNKKRISSCVDERSSNTKREPALAGIPANPKPENASKIYEFTWKVRGGLGDIIRGKDRIELPNDTTRDEFEELITSAIGGGSNFVLKQELNICHAANECDESCDNWKIYKLKEIKPEKPKTTKKKVKN